MSFARGNGILIVQLTKTEVLGNLLYLTLLHFMMK
jgi:hypothetical protein